MDTPTSAETACGTGRRRRSPGLNKPTPSTAGNAPITTTPEDSGSPQAKTGERLQKVLAHAGIASRRHAEDLMRNGRVAVNGVVVRELGSRVMPDHDLVTVDGAPIQRVAAHTYVLLNKPVGPITTAADPQGRKTVLDLLPAELRARRVYPVGRLDHDTEGLLLLTDDGDLALRLTHPRYALPKVYEALVAGHPPDATLAALERGIQMRGDSRPTAPARAWTIGNEGSSAWIGLEIHEGRNRQVRRMLAEVGHPVRRLRRTRVGPLEVGALAPGSWRLLTARELRALRQALARSPSRSER